ncbi:MAG: aspartyl/asparaginyl beta-hydroxylase domain-containing protein [Acidobacteria bacterium]|nr:aspartyl/asparaginyl beta-hydroxylase domain-containing protein [Acidobacteriota bacterium]
MARLSERVWVQEDATKENDFRCFHHTRHVIFRFIACNRDPRRFYSRPSWAVWERMLLPVIAKAAAPYEFVAPVYPKVMLARLEAGHRIDLHVDGEGSHPLTHKVHVPLETNPAAVLQVDGADFHLAAGRAFEVNNLVPHGAFNGGASDRIHLIFEVFEGAGVA